MKKIFTLLLLVVFATTISAQTTAPTFKTEAGTYYNPFTVELTGENIYYTLDGTDPTTESAKYSTAISINKFNTTTTIKAASFSNETRSDVVSATYELKVAAPEFSVKSGVYEKLTNNNALKFTTKTEDAKIYYNQKGGDPIENGERAYGALALSILATKTINAVAIVKVNGVEYFSDIVSEHYEISPITLFVLAKEINDDKYIINYDIKVASSFYSNIEKSNFNTLYIGDHMDKYIETNEFNGFTFATTDGGYTIQDAYNRYLYIDRNENLCATKSKPATGAVWSVEINKSTSRATIKNVSRDKFIAYDTKEGVFGLFAEIDNSHTLPLLYEETEYPTITITPEDGDTINEFHIVTVVCDKGIEYDDNDKYARYYIGYSSENEFYKSKQIDENTIEFSIKYAEKSNNEYKVVFPAGVFTLDPNGLAQKNKDITIRYTVENKDILEITLANPAHKDALSSLQYLYFEFNQDITKKDLANAVITDKKGNQYPLSISDIDSWGDKCLDNALCLSTAEPITSEGEYTFVLKKEYISAKGNDALTIENDMTYTFTIEESLNIKSITPNSSDIYDSVSEIKIVLNKAAKSDQLTDIIVTDKDNNSYKFTKSSQNVITSSELKFTTDTPITEAGTYSFTIGNGLIYWENPNSDMSQLEAIPETTFTFIVKYATSIEDIDAEKEVTVIYDLAGRRIDNITDAGIYIVNGKKVLKK